jgi:phage-related holin
MLEAIMETLRIMGWLGIVLGILATVNLVCGTIYNINDSQTFSWKKFFKGILKVVIFYMSAVFVSVAFTMLPYINTMITDAFGVVLLSSELLNTLSSVAVLGIVVASVVTQAKKAFENISKLSTMSSDVEVITWDVVEPEEDEIKEEEASI